MAFNIPKAWTPGLALPQYIRDEGLQRHAFTTLEVPDGTYDNPAVGDGGFAVPKYIMDEGYGQGAFITKYAPRGTYFGPKIPNWLNKPGGNTIVNEKPAKGGGTQFTLKSMGSLGDIPVPTPTPTTTSGAGAGLLEKYLPWAAAAAGAYFLLRKKKGR